MELVSYINKGIEWEVPDDLSKVFDTAPTMDGISLKETIENCKKKGEFQLMLDDDNQAYALVLNQSADDFYELERYMCNYGCTIALYLDKNNEWRYL